MGTDTQADVERLAQDQLEGAAGPLKCCFALGDRYADDVALFFDPDPLRSVHVGLDLARRTSPRVPVLKRREPAPVQGGVGIRRISVQALPDNHASLAVRVHPGADPPNGRGERNIPRDPLPDELELIAGVPHVLPAACKKVLTLGGVVLDRSGVAGIADVAVPFEESEILLLGQSGSGGKDDSHAQTRETTCC